MQVRDDDLRKTSLRAYLHSHDSKLTPISYFFPLFITGYAHKLILRSYEETLEQSLMADSSSHRLDLRVGGKYRLGKKIGSGSFGTL